MFGKYIKISLLAILAAVSLNVLFQTQSFAVLESYSWSNFNTITASSGIYGSMNTSQSDTLSVEFVQSKDNPKRYVVSNPGENCSGKLIINFTNSDTEGTLTSEGDCSIFRGADKTINRVQHKDVAVQSVDDKEKEIIDTYVKKTCGSVQPAEMAACTDAASKKHKAEKDRCFSENNYKQQVTKGAGYLECLAAGLDVVPDDKKAGDKVTGEDVKCEIQDAGWIICGIVTFMAHLTDATFKLLLPFLIVDPLSTELGTSGESTTYSAWSQMRNIANVVFVVGFLIIIFSQLTNIGIDAYGIKKLMPRLVVASILMNLSFFICAIAVDVSNVVGKSAQSVLFELAETQPKSASDKYSDWTDVSNTVISTPTTVDPEAEKGAAPADEAAAEEKPKEDGEDESFSRELTNITVGGVALYGTMALFAQLALLVPMLIAALFAMITVLLVLLMRQAVIIVLVVVAPIAFALYLLPNTQKWFDRWRSTLFDMLVLFPAIAVVFGGSFLASQIIRKTAEENGEVLLTIFSLGILVIPLFVAPLLIKLGGGVMNQFGGIVNNKRKGLYDRSMNRAKSFKDDRVALKQSRAANGKMLFGKIDLNSGKGQKGRNFISHYRKPNRQARREKAFELAGENAEHATNKYLNDKDVASKNIQDATKGFDDATAAAIQETLIGKAVQGMDKIETEETDAAVAKFRDKGANEVLGMAESGMAADGRGLSNAERTAAIRLATEQFKDRASGDGQDGIDKVHRLVAQSNSMSNSQRRELISGIRSSGVSSRAAHLGGSALGKIERGDIKSENDINGLVDSAAKGGKFSQNALATQSESTLKLLRQRMNASDLEPDVAAGMQRVKIDAAQTLQNRNLSTGLTDNARNHLENMR